MHLFFGANGPQESGEHFSKLLERKDVSRDPDHKGASLYSSEKRSTGLLEITETESNSRVKSFDIFTATCFSNPLQLTVYEHHTFV